MVAYRSYANPYANPSTSSGSTTAGTIAWSGISTAATSTGTLISTAASTIQDFDSAIRYLQRTEIFDGEEVKIKLPDGAFLQVEKNGSYRIEDKNAKITYRAHRTRDFNPFLNASDKLEQFIKYCGDHGVRQDEMLNMPVKHFIAWLIVEAARQDDIEPPVTEIPLLPPPKKLCRCGSCGRFLSNKKKSANVFFCATECFERKLASI